MDYQEVIFNAKDFSVEVLCFRKMKACIMADQTLKVTFGNCYPSFVQGIIERDYYSYHLKPRNLD